MENPEEVLQALDEFQKMRPAEIPRELEDYLCFVAKTGDPVYQWSLIKPLFREKLVRVMTDFYESCPTLDLAPSPNLEQFNYDSMKGNLLDLLESFANAPFTVQRICELLTSPRKEYNRVDKFMRAIEKNILVVSTREPGPAARRSENGDSMINGTIDDETPTSQPSHEVEMEWVKDCTTESNVALASQEHDVPLVETVMPSKLVKDEDPLATVIQEKSESRTDIGVNNFIATHELTTTAQLTPTVQSHEPLICPSSVQNLGTNVGDVGGIVGDVPEAIMNEDTSSQPSLESESDDSEPSSRKLQTTFQSRDFAKDGKTKYYQDGDKNEDKRDSQAKKNSASDDATKLNDKLNYSDHHADSSIDEPVLEKRPRLDDSVSSVVEQNTLTAPEANSPPSTVKEEPEPPEPEVKAEEPKVISEPIPVAEPEQPASERVDIFVEEIPEFSTGASCPQEQPAEDDGGKEAEEVASPTAKPIIEEPPYDESEESSRASKSEEDGIVIQEAMDDDAKVTNTMVPDPIPIVEEPKEDSSVSTTEETIDEIVEKEPASDADPVDTSKEEVSVSIEQLCEPVVQQEPVVSVDSSELTSIETLEKVEATPMDVDSEESMPMFQQDEPMEEESAEQLKS